MRKCRKLRRASAISRRAISDFSRRELLAAALLAIASGAALPPALAAAPARDRIAMLQPRPPEHLSVFSDISLAGMVPGGEKLLAKKRGDQLAKALVPQKFDLAQTLALQVAAALPDVQLRRVAYNLEPLSRSKADGWATAPMGDCHCDFWLDLVIEEAGFRSTAGVDGFRPTLTVKFALIGSLGRKQIAAQTVKLRPEWRGVTLPQTNEPAVPNRADARVRKFEDLLADPSGAVRNLRNAAADLASEIAQRVATAAGVRRPDAPEPQDDRTLTPLPPDQET